MSNHPDAALSARRAERAAARSSRASGDLTDEWRHLQRAHVLSQATAAVIRLGAARIGLRAVLSTRDQVGARAGMAT